jgi:hypothetical protein
MTKTPMTWMHMLEPDQRARRGPIPMEVWAAHGWLGSLPECSAPDLGGHPENDPPQPSWNKGRVFFVVMVVRKIAATHAGMPACR